MREAVLHYWTDDATRPTLDGLMERATLEEAAAAIDLTFDGLAGDFHAGATRRSGGREPWYPRGTEMRNERQVSIVAADGLMSMMLLSERPGAICT